MKYFGLDVVAEVTEVGNTEVVDLLNAIGSSGIDEANEVFGEEPPPNESPVKTARCVDGRPPVVMVVAPVDPSELSLCRW